MRFLLTALLCGGLAASAAPPIVRFTITEDAGIDRTAALVEQGLPVPPMSKDAAARLAIIDKEGHAVPAGIEIDGVDPHGLVRWLRISLPVNLKAWERRPLDLVAGAPAAVPALQTDISGDRISVAGSGYRAMFRRPDQFELTREGAVLFDGPITFQIYSDARSIINAGGKTTVLAGFVPSGFRLERPSPQRATVVLTGRYPKQKAYASGPGQVDARNAFDVDLRFHFSALSANIGFDWRLTNRTGYKAWLERYALVLPLKPKASVEIAAPFLEDLGVGAGVRSEAAGLLIGGLDMPPDGSLGGRIPEIHRLFYNGMSRTFPGTLVLSGGLRSAAPGVHIVVPAQYYSDVGVLPEHGGRVDSGEFAPAVERSARWLLQNQWRGTLWWGEWWREWDVVRKQGTEEASNGNSVLAPLYHYLRTGDRRFLECASRSASYAFDVQHDKQRTGFGPMLHTRRHLLDELNWIHPRYQRAYGPMLASHILLMDRERAEIIATVRHFSEQVQDADGTPHDWDEVTNRKGGETGVDTSNFIEALTAAWQETGNPFFLDRARGYARWTLKKWRSRTDERQWNWNLTRYVLTGMLAMCRAALDRPDLVPERQEFLAGALEISRHTVQHPEYGFVPGTIGEGGLHYFFYHAWLDTEISRLAKDPSLIPLLASAIRSQMSRQDAEGAFPMDVGALWSQYPTSVISYYDPKSVVAYLPV
ncbi:MAG TPA: hypothetical protein VMZ52_05605, partial [Bryobacteraceae bacterium]|nr:hypothetical protein [Bryobacteraceae bacterium]